MQAEYQNRLVASAAMAASQPPETGAEEIVRAAIRAGAALLCDHGILVPLWVLLDVLALRSHRYGAAGIPPERHGAPFQPYDDWLRAFLTVQSARLGKPAPVEGTPRVDCLAALGRCWPPMVHPQDDETWKVRQGNTFAWIAAYRSLDTRVPALLAGWRGPRQFYEPGWPALAAALGRRLRLAALDGALVDAFLQGRTDWPVYELFDAAAAHIYLAASDFDVAAMRALRQAALRHVSRSEDPPELDAVEEPHHAVGVWTLSTLAQGRYGIFKLTNQSYPRLAGRPRSQPPLEIRIYLEWALSMGSLERPVALPAGLRLPGIAPSQGREVRVSQASVLQGFCALVLDDWHEALAGIPAELHVRARRSEQDGWHVPSRGTRWKSVFVAGGLSPPAEFVKQLFSRTTTVSLLTQSQRLAGPSGKDAPDCGEWRCGCLLKDDLEQEDGAGGWRCPREAIAPNWEHVLVLDPEHATGWMARIEERPPDVFLRKQFASGDQEDFSFLSLRKLAAETMLDALVRHASQGRW